MFIRTFHQTYLNLIIDYYSSVAKNGFDFKKAYGGGVDDEPSVSTASGMKSAYSARKGSKQSNMPEHRSRLESEIKGESQISMFTDDNSFEAMYNEEEQIVVKAPSGKLGIVIDTPSAGVPVVHAIKETSVLVNNVRIGDKLISVDGEDTTTLSAIRVSKLISSKARNPERVMVFLRSRNE